MGSKWATNTCLSIPNGPRSLLERCFFDPYWTHFLSPNSRFSRHFGILHGPKGVTTSSKRAKNTCLSIQSGLRTTLQTISFFAPGTLVDPLLAPAMRGLGCPPAPASDHWYGGRGVSLGESEAWKPQIVGGCGWSRCPRKSVLSHVAQDTARSWFRACLTQTTHIQAIFGHFWAVSQTYRQGRGQQKVLITGQSRRMWSVATVCLRLAVLTWFRGCSWAKIGCLGAQNAQLCGGTSSIGAPAPGRHR